MIEILDKRELAPKSFRYDLQALNEDIVNLPTEGVAAGSTCLIIDIDKTYRFYDGGWVLVGTANRQYINGERLFDGRHEIASPDINLDDKIITTSTKKMFNGCTNLISVGNALNFYKNVGDVSEMFNGCGQITDIPNIVVPANTNCNSMFRDCTELVNIGKLELGKPTEISYMFYGCENLKAEVEIDCSKLNIKQFRWECAFQNTPVKATLKGLSSDAFSTLARNCVEGVDGPPLADDVEQITLIAREVVTMPSTGPLKGDLPDMILPYGITENIFGFGVPLDRLNAFITLNESSNKDFSGMPALYEVGYNDKYTDCRIAFFGNIDKLNFKDCEALVNVDLSQVNGITSITEMFKGDYDLKNVKFAPNTKVNFNLTSTFEDCENLAKVENLILDENGVRLDRTFKNAFVSPRREKGKVQHINLAEILGVDHIKVKGDDYHTLYETFSGCEHLETIPELDTSEADNMIRAFENCANLTGEIHLDMSTTTKEYGQQQDMISGTDPEKCHFFLHNVRRSWADMENQYHAMLGEQTNYTIVNVIDD